MAWRSARAHSCAVRILVLPSRASSPICPNETIRSGLIQASGNPRTRHHEPEILNILNWPVESRRGAPVERWRGHGFRRPAPSHLCLDTPLQLRFLSPLIEPSVRISRTGLSFEIMRSHTRSRPVRPSGVPDRSATERPESARLPGLRLGPPPQLPTRPLWRPRPCSRPPLRGHRELASLLACDTIRNFRTVSGACRLAPVPWVPVSFLASLSNQGPFPPQALPRLDSYGSLRHFGCAAGPSTRVA